MPRFSLGLIVDYHYNAEEISSFDFRWVCPKTVDMQWYTPIDEGKLVTNREPRGDWNELPRAE